MIAIPNLRRNLLATAAVLTVTAFAAGCGDDDPEPTTPVQPAVQQGTMKQGATGPASAGTKRPAAPDDKISQRPGGPGDKGKKKKKAKKTVGNSGGISVSPGQTPSSP